MNYENKETTTDTSASERQPSAALRGDRPITIGSFCSGYGGLEMGVDRAFGGNTRTIFMVEREAFAIANMASKIQEKRLDQALIYNDVRTFPYRKYRGLVDIAVAGIPCQPHSSAGKRKGGDDERFLFDEWIEGVGVMRPSYVLIENVEGLLSSRMPNGTLCFGHVLRRLEDVGYQVERPDKTISFGTFSAAEVIGGDGRRIPHLRKRVFILAKLADGNGEGLEGRKCGSVQERTRQLLVGESGSQALYPARPNERQRWWEEPRVVGDAKSVVRQRSDGETDKSGSAQEEVGGHGAGGGEEDGELADSNSGRQPPRIESRSGEKADSRRQENSIEGYGVGELADSKSGKPRKSKGRDRRKDTGGGSEEVGQLGDTSSERLRGGCEDCADVESEVPRKGSESILADAQHAERRTDEGLSSRNERREGTSGDAEGCLQADLPETQSELGGTVDAWGGLRGVDPTANRVDRLRLLGNGVCVDTCVLAFTTLYNRLNKGETTNE